MKNQQVNSSSTSEVKSIKKSDLNDYVDYDEYTEHLDTIMNNANSSKTALDHILTSIEKKKIFSDTDHSEHADEIIHTDVEA